MASIKPGNIVASGFVLVAGMLSTGAGRAGQLPLWEVGLGGASLSLPDYRGSDQRTNYLLPAPYLVYRGEFLKADRNGLRTKLFDNDKLELSLSLNGTLPVRSTNNVARSGMPDLKPAVEVGGNMSVNLWRTPDRRMALELRAPLRSAITIEASPKQIGWVFSPGLNLHAADPFGYRGWNLGLLAGPLFSNRDYNAYFYSVSPTQALASRPAFDARGGYSGSQFTMTLSKRFKNYWVGGFLREDSLAGAVFQDSPLVLKRNGFSAGLAISWIFGESSKMVEASE
jgi:outer membrane protein